MAVDDLDIAQLYPSGPNETDPPLIVDAHAVLSGPVSLRRLQAIAKRNSVIAKHFRLVQRTQLAVPIARKAPKDGRQPAASSPAPDYFSLEIGEARGHRSWLRAHMRLVAVKL